MAFGDTRVALVDMTGPLVETTWLKDDMTHTDKNRLWKQMMTSNNTEFGPLLTTGINPMDKTEQKRLGLYGKHAYSVTAAKEVSLEGIVKKA